MTCSIDSLKTLRCSVLGAGGFIGSNLCKALAGRVKSLRAFGRRQLFPEALEGCTWIPGDFSDIASVLPAITDCDIVFHLINTSTPASANIDKIADLNENVISTLRLLNACRECGVSRIVFVSSGGTIYGIPDQVPTPETAPNNPITAYGIGKLAIEKYLGLYQYLYQLDYRVLRVANPFGPYQVTSKNQGVIAAFIQQALAGSEIQIWGDGNTIRDYIYIDDVIEALLLASVHKGRERIFNIGSGKGLSLNDIVCRLGYLLGREIPVKRCPSRKVDVPVNILDITAARRELQWRPRISLDEGLSYTIGWTRTTNKQTT